MREIDTNNLIRYQTGKYKGKIDWSNNIGSKLPFKYNNQKGEIEIIDYVKGIPQGLATVKYKDNIQQMKTNNLLKCSISNLIGRFNYDYLYNTDDILNTKHNSTIKILKQIELLHTNYPERGYTVKCLDCGHVYDIREVYVASCPNCSDRVSYPEKFVINLFKQLGESIELQKRFDWADLKRYDIYVPIHNMIIEVNGLLHYEPVYLPHTNKNYDKYKELAKVQLNDKEKYELALENNIINYIVIDARESNMGYIKNSILTNSDLQNFYNFIKRNT